MSPTEKASAAVSKLIRLTKEGKLVWSESAEAGRFVDQRNESLVVGVETNVEGRRLVLYETESYQGGYDETDNIDLVVCDERGQLVWRFPQTSGLWELLNAARYTAGKMDSFLDNLLKAQS